MADLRKNYVISYSFAESGRLYLQQWLWKMQLGWDLHPEIKLPEDGEIHIADHGCGNGAWLLSLAAELDEAQMKRVSMRGFDISPIHYPAVDNLPKSLSLGVLDAFAETLPIELVGKFDVVHVRMFTAVVKNNNPGPLIANAVKMLKPGGYLQWDEMDSASLKAISPNSSVPATATQEMLDTALLSAKRAMNLDYSWIRNLGPLFDHHGLDVVADFQTDVKGELRKPMTDSLLMSLDHIAKIAVRDGRMVGTDKNWDELWSKSGLEVEKGVSVVMDMLLCVGRKREDA